MANSIELTIGARDRVSRTLSGVTRKVSGFTRSTTRQFDSMSRRVLSFRSAIVGLAGAAVVTKVARIASSFQQLRIRLRTVTGDAKLAADAFRLIQNVAVTTPFEVERITEAFIDLRLRGVNPTRELLVDFVDLAAAFGKDITEVSLAVTQTLAKQNEGLRKFGIDAKFNGDQITLSFQGISRTVENTGQNVADFLAEVARSRFAGAAKEQVNSVAGAFSNLSDNFSAFADQIGRSGLNEGLANVAKALGGAIGQAGGLADLLGKISGEALGAVASFIRNVDEADFNRAAQGLERTAVAVRDVAVETAELVARVERLFSFSSRRDAARAKFEKKVAADVKRFQTEDLRDALELERQQRAAGLPAGDRLRNPFVRRRALELGVITQEEAQRAAQRESIEIWWKEQATGARYRAASRDMSLNVSGGAGSPVNRALGGNIPTLGGLSTPTEADRFVAGLGGSGADTTAAAAEENVVAFTRAAKAADGFHSALLEIRERRKDFAIMHDSVLDVAGAMEDSLGGALFDVISGTKDVGDAFADMARNVLRDINRIIARMIAMKALQTATGFLLGGSGPPTVSGPLAGGGAAVATAAGAAVGNPFAGLAFSATAAVPQFQTGGVARMPKSGGLAELHGVEAVVPLKGGRSIPVEGRFGGRGDNVLVLNMPVTVNDAVDSAKVTRAIRSRALEVAAVVSQAQRSQGILRRGG